VALVQAPLKDSQVCLQPKALHLFYVTSIVLFYLTSMFWS